jgi:hypothetical protein
VPVNATSTDTATPSASELPTLVAAVQHNCDLADAGHADGRSLCTYLLGLRELFRWETGLPLGAAPNRSALAGWISARERRWEALGGGGQSFARLPLASGIDPFDEATVNRHLAGRGLVYGAGIGLFGAPLFFLAERRSTADRDGASVIVAGTELARGIVAPPAASRGGTITIRLDALRRWLWTRVEVARRAPPGNSFAAALRGYGDPEDAATVERMVQGETETLVLHELGEMRAGVLLGDEWESMLAGIGDRRTELLVRAVRDLLADCLVTLPALAERGADHSLRFWQASFDGLRRQLAPELVAALRDEPGPIDREAVSAAAGAGRSRWLGQAAELLTAWRDGGETTLQRRAATLSKGS